MWERLGEVCEALADPDETGTSALWRELSGGVLERACRSALHDGARAHPTMVRCLDLLSGDHLIARLTPLLDGIGRWDWYEPEHVLEDAREEILGAVLASLALRCAGGESVGSGLLHWAARFGLHQYPVSGSPDPVRPDRPASWIEACVPPLLRANPRLVQSCGVDRLGNILRSHLWPALRRLQQHDLDEFLQGADPAQVSALQRLLLACPLRDVRDLDLALAGAGEIRLARSDGFLTPAEDIAPLPRLIASDDIRVQLISLVVLPKVLDDCASSRSGGPLVERLQDSPWLRDALDFARANPHPVVAALAVCAAAQTAQPAVPPLVAVRLLRDPRPVVRAAAAWAVGRIAGGATWGAELAPLLADPAASVRLAAATAVRQLGGPAATPSVLTCLLPLLEDDDPEVRREAIEAAGALGPALTEAFVERLAALTRGASEIVRFESLRALGATGIRGRSPAVLSALVARFDDCDPFVRECALRAYAGLDAPADSKVLARVAEMLEERDEGIRTAAVDLLAQIGHSTG